MRFRERRIPEFPRTAPNRPEARYRELSPGSTSALASPLDSSPPWPGPTAPTCCRSGDLSLRPFVLHRFRRALPSGRGQRLRAGPVPGEAAVFSSTALPCCVSTREYLAAAGSGAGFVAVPKFWAIAMGATPIAIVSTRLPKLRIGRSCRSPPAQRRGDARAAGRTAVRPSANRQVPAAAAAAERESLRSRPAAAAVGT